MSVSTGTDSTSQVNHWTLTWNHGDTSDTDIGKCLDQFNSATLVKYAVMQQELGANGNRHIQGYVEFKRSKRLAAVRKLVPGGHWEPRRGTRTQAREYCLKEETRIPGSVPREYGEWIPEKEDKATAYGRLQQDIDSGVSVRELAKRNFTLFMRHAGAIGTYRQMVQPKRQKVSFNIECFKLARPDRMDRLSVFLHGPTNTGKTSYALSLFDSPILCRHVDDLKNFDKEFHDGIVFDDMSFEHWSPGAVIHLLDLEHDAPIHARYNNVIIPAGTERVFTSNKDWIFYTNEVDIEQRQAIDRRVQNIEVTSDIRVGEDPDLVNELDNNNHLGGSHDL